LTGPSFKRFTNKLSRLCKASGISQVELSRRLGMQPSHLNIFLRGRSDVHSQRLISLLYELGINIEAHVDAALDIRALSPQNDTENLAQSLERVSHSERESLSVIISRLARMAGQEKR
jgi:transcriptional regulator with XRE-family HTH domain